MEPFGEQLKKARKRIKLSQDQLCHRTGMAKSCIQSIETGRTKVPDTLTVMKLMTSLKGALFEFEYAGKRFVMRQEGLADKVEP
jgi:predicted transcriptional regulator